ncbi:MAG: ATP-binding cassette domain-containing protein [Bacteroidales bacterium]|nr:ATP-binding cassette domain-containing protein [Bacteroidales bacterium]
MEHATQILIALNKITAAYNGKVVLENVNLTVRSNDFIGIIGPNGGGKTTLVKVILGLLKPLRGKVHYKGDPDPGKISIGYLPQIHKIDYKFPITVWDTVLSGLISDKRLVGNFPKENQNKAANLMAELGIGTLSNKPVGELSGGQLQRVFLCRAIISNPDILILDEPNTYVDNKFEGELYETLRKLNDRMAILIVSHDVGMISAYVKTIACVNRELHYHESNIISQEQLLAYNCPIQLITHGDVPHTVLHKHEH